MSEQHDEFAELLARAAMADRNAFHKLYVLTSPRVYGVLVSMLQDKDMAQDVLQDTYVKVWNRATEYHRERGRVLSWIIAIARYRALDLLRASKRRSAFEHQSRETVEPALSIGETFSDLMTDCLGRLADTQRYSIVAAFVHGLTHEELAAYDDAPLGTVKSRIRRGLRRLRECLEQ